MNNHLDVTATQQRSSKGCTSFSWEYLVLSITIQDTTWTIYILFSSNHDPGKSGRSAIRYGTHSFRIVIGCVTPKQDNSGGNQIPSKASTWKSLPPLKQHNCGRSHIKGTQVPLPSLEKHHATVSGNFEENGGFLSPEFFLRNLPHF